MSYLIYVRRLLIYLLTFVNLSNECYWPTTIKELIGVFSKTLFFSLVRNPKVWITYPGVCLCHVHKIESLQHQLDALKCERYPTAILMPLCSHGKTCVLSMYEHMCENKTHFLLTIFDKTLSCHTHLVVDLLCLLIYISIDGKAPSLSKLLENLMVLQLFWGNYKTEDPAEWLLQRHLADEMMRRWNENSKYHCRDLPHLDPQYERRGVNFKCRRA